MTEPRLNVSGLRVVLPTGRVLIEDLSLSVAPGEVVVLLGGSGSGKSTFSRVLFEPDALARSGFDIQATTLEVDRDQLGLVPQRGALFDHLDVRGNLELALRYRAAAAAPAAADGSLRGGRDAHADEPARWLERVGLDRDLAARGTPVASLSGGQAQRVAVARVLAGRRRLLFLDEPSVGLDPHRVRMLARLIREQVDDAGVSAIVVTHDVALAAGCADRLLLLDPDSRRLVELFAGEWPGPLERADLDADERGRWLVALESELIARIDRAAPGDARASTGRPASAWLRGALDRLAAPFRVAAGALADLPGHAVRRPGDFVAVGRRVLGQSLVRPVPFYAVVSVLIGYTVLLVISKVGGAGIRPDALVRQIGGSYVVALAPPLSAILFVAASGSAVNAWLGSMGLTRQTLALDALGVPSRAYLHAPAWLTLALAYLATAATFALGMIAGGLLVCRQYGLDGGWALLTADLLDPRPERVRYAVRAAFLVWIYAWGIASDVVAKGAAHKEDADAVTRGMTASVIACTLWIVAWELISVIVAL